MIAWRAPATRAAKARASSLADVAAQRARLAAAGHDVGQGESAQRGGCASTACYDRAPGGVLVEVTSPHPAGRPASPA